MPPRSPFPLLTTPSDSRTAMLQGLLIGVIVIAGLYFAREVLLPLALAILLSFVLTPPLLLLGKIKVPRVLAVGIVVAAAFAIIFGLGWMMSREVTQLASTCRATSTPSRRRSRACARACRARQPWRGRAKLLTELQKELASRRASPAKPKVGAHAAHPDDKPMPVEITRA